VDDNSSDPNRRVVSTITKALAAATGISALLLASPATAREAVDPSTLNPAPPDFFNAVCTSTGQHITCTLGFSDPDIVDEPSGIVCGSTELLFSQSRSVVGKRFYDSDGNLLQRHFREYMGGTFTNPDTGRSVTWIQHDTVLHDLAVPGDNLTGTISLTGLTTRVAGVPGLSDAGRLLIDASTDEVVTASAHHPFDAYFREGDAAALAPLCDALD
jgi:hypothetical protein